ncbi:MULTISPECIES: penicillin-binding protein 2 [Bacillaceae]|uniref:peptidoglycan D,D-transpeptidase FtsI family protein n=1 Tax=Bacillaceae TaxID=186817 RepID=UPI001046ECD0|nr:penicillin-binding protein 2 [Bacillus sp. CBEL-1]TDB50863.1 penicillin-binding protein 2 [Bacillus sp. CBEL-1]
MRVVRKRMQSILIIIMLLIFLLIGRLVQIQLISTESFSNHNVNLIEESVHQRTQEMVVDDGRGKFIDRNGQSLTSVTNNRLVLFPFLNEMKWPMQQVSTITGISTVEMVTKLKDTRSPVAVGDHLTIDQLKQVNELKIPGVFGVPLKDNRPIPIAEHVIGLVRQSQEKIVAQYEDKLKSGELKTNTPIGITGMQKTFDEFLLPQQESKLLYHVDRFGGPMFGIDVKYTGDANPFYPVNVKTTLDLTIQEKVEELLEQYNLKEGGVVLLDIEKSNILAMASRPNINQTHPYEEKAKGLYNRMLIPQVPGSVFKTVTAAAAVEEGVLAPNMTFNCDQSIYDQPLENGHQKGMLSFEESFAQSCNKTFAQLAKQMSEKNPDSLDQYAQKLGLTDPVGWSGDVFHFDHFTQLQEGKGTVWQKDTNKHVPNAISQTAIGQLDVKLTPLAVANMMATIARGGEKRQVKIVDEIQYKNKASLYTFKNKKLPGENIEKQTVRELQQLLSQVVQSDDGTGRRFRDLPYSVAGKSGTAEIDVENEIVNKWFAGYFPADKPKYALVVVDLNTKSTISSTNQVFYDIVKEMYDLNHQ